MPRQLPWVSKGGGSRTQVKQPPAKKQRNVFDAEDDFFDGTVLAGSSKGKERIKESEDDLPDLLVEPSTPHSKSRNNDAHGQKRAPSSSPPPIADLEQPQIESMHMGVSKFDLRDDEWMMVEDEFLETAKLFTRHLHIAEYEKLKERIEEKKKEAKVERPVVPNAKMSIESATKEKARVQERRQRKAIRDVFVSRTAEKGDKTSSSLVAPSRAPSTASRPLSNAYNVHDTDSDDLDTPHPVKAASSIATATTPVLPRHRRPATTPSKPASSPPSTTTTAPLPFAKPLPPTHTTKLRTPRPSRATPFDMLDAYTPRNPLSTPRPIQEQTLSHSPPSSNIFIQPLTPGKTRRSTDVFEAGSAGTRGETDERLAKRKAEMVREETEKEKAPSKRKAVKLDEIPTFLF